MMTWPMCPVDRFPVIVVEFASVFDHRPPTIIYANAAMCRLSEYSLVRRPFFHPPPSRFRFRSFLFAIRSYAHEAWVQDQLIGAPVTALIVLQETHRRVLGPYITRQYALPTPEEFEFRFNCHPFKFGKTKNNIII